MNEQTRIEARKSQLDISAIEKVKWDDVIEIDRKTT